MLAICYVWYATHLMCLYLSWHDTVSFDALRLSKMLRSVKKCYGVQVEKFLSWNNYEQNWFDWPCLILIDSVLRSSKKEIFMHSIKRPLNYNSCNTVTY